MALSQTISATSATGRRYGTSAGRFLQIAAGLRQRNVRMRVFLIVELLDQAYRAGERGANT